MPIDFVQACILSQPLVQVLHTRKVWLPVLLHHNESFWRLHRQFETAQTTLSLYEKTLIGPKRAVFNFFQSSMGGIDPGTPLPRAYATAQQCYACLIILAAVFSVCHYVIIRVVNSRVHFLRTRTRATGTRTRTLENCYKVLMLYFSRAYGFSIMSGVITTSHRDKHTI